MQLTSLENSIPEISRETVNRLFEPFVGRSFSPDEPEWRKEINRRKRSILRKYLKRVFHDWSDASRRDKAAVITEYSKAWNHCENYGHLRQAWFSANIYTLN